MMALSVVRPQRPWGVASYSQDCERQGASRRSFLCFPSPYRRLAPCRSAGRASRFFLFVMIAASLMIVAVPLHADEAMPAPARIEGHAELAANVGMMAGIQQVVLPGSELIPRATDSRTAPVVIRIDAVYSHGDGFRYDLTWSAYESGTHDLTKYLARKDGTSTDDLPPLIVSATATLPPKRVAPNAPDSQPRISVGGYRALMWLGGLLWVAGLVAIMLRGRNRSTFEVDSTDKSPQSRLDVIRSLVASAVSSGEFSVADKARLEGLIVGFWREHKQIQELPAQAALARLSNDPDAGPLLRQLERWLYDRPQPEQLDLNVLLSPLDEMAARNEEPQV